MTEPVKEPVKEAEEPAPEIEETIEANPTEDKAREQGWVSKDEWVDSGKSADEWRSAKEFVDRGELFQSIHTTKRELKQTQSQLTALQRHHQNVFEKARQSALADLKRDRRAALMEQDIEEVEAIEEQIEETTKQFEIEKQQLLQSQAATQSGPPPEFVTWQEKNDWYSRDSELRDIADANGLVYIKRNPDAQPSEVLRYVEQTVRKQFPAKFMTKKAAVSPTSSADKTLRPAKKESFELDEMETEIMKTVVGTGVMTKEQYIADLKKAKGVK